MVLITVGYGLGENVERGTINPDEYYVFKPTLTRGFRPILQRRLGSKEMKLVYDARGGTQKTRNVPVPASERGKLALIDDEVLQLARWGVAVEEHYSRKAGRPMPMDLEWAKDGRTGELFILQARPETVQSRRDVSTLEVHRLAGRATPLLSGQAVGSKVGRGRVRVVRDASRLADCVEGEILVTEMTDPDWVPVLKRPPPWSPSAAAAPVTRRSSAANSGFLPWWEPRVL